MKPIISLLDKSSAYQQLRRDMRAMKQGFTKVGFPARQQVGKGTKGGSGHKPAKEMSEIAFIAAKNEFGVPAKSGGEKQWKIPPRPFFRNALDKNRGTLGRFIERQYHRVLAGVASPREGLGLIGEWLAAKVKKSIRETVIPPNAAMTIAAKKSSHPLIDTGQMLNSVMHVEHLHSVGVKTADRRTAGKLRVIQG